MAKLALDNQTGERIEIGLDQEQRVRVVETLNKLLSDEHVLYVKTRNYHWNVTGPRFHSLHEMFEQQYEELSEIIDEVAENARQFGGFALGTMREFIENTQLDEQPGEIPDEDGMILNLRRDHEKVIQWLRGAIATAADELKADDAADFLTAVLERHNKMAWMLRAMTPLK
jgi:starvation-inducible DNA-binding protein